jgi:Lon protease-like protein
MEEFLLPLFPLETVLLPEEPLPLHIFEDRYKEMIGECLKSKAEASGMDEFGIVLAKGEEMSMTGCSARIINLTRKYADGRMDIFTIGARRFEVLFTNEERSFLRGGVEFFDDDAGMDTPSEAAGERAIELFRQIMQLMHKSPDIPIHFPRPHRYLSFRIASPLPLDPNFKQELLPVRNENVRLERVVKVIQALIPKLDSVLKVRQRAGGNGNARLSG